MIRTLTTWRREGKPWSVWNSMQLHAVARLPARQVYNKRVSCSVNLMFLCSICHNIFFLFAIIWQRAQSLLFLTSHILITWYPCSTWRWSFEVRNLGCPIFSNVIRIDDRHKVCNLFIWFTKRSPIVLGALYGPSYYRAQLALTTPLRSGWNKEADKRRRVVYVLRKV